MDLGSKIFGLVSWTLLVLCVCCLISGSETLNEVRSWYTWLVYMPSLGWFVGTLFQDFKSWKKEQMERSEQ